VFGHKWEPAHGTIVESVVEQRAIDGQHGLHEVRVYTVDIRKGGGQHQRVRVPAPPTLQGELPAGTAVRLQVHGKSGEVRFDPDNIAIRVNVSSARDALHLARELRTEMSSGGFGAAMQQFADLAQQQAAAHPGATPQVHVATAAQAQEMMQQLMAGATSREDAQEKIRQWRESLAAQAKAGRSGGAGMSGGPAPAAPPVPSAPAAPEGFSSGGPATFEEVTPAAPPVTPVAPAAPFGSPASFDPVPPASTFTNPASPANPFDVGGQFGPQPFPASQPAGSFGGFGESKSDRIAALQDQRDRGQLTQQQYETLRQQIQDEF
jgi:hypothetical protein